MKYSDLVKETAKLSGVSQATAKDVLDEACDIIRAAVDDGEEVTLNRVGKFSKRIRSARIGFNPTTKEKIEVPTVEVVIFKVAKEFKDFINHR